MDITMPGLDAVEATRQIKARSADIRIVVLTMHADQDVLADAIRAGANGYLVKDCSTDEIAEAIRMAANEDATLSPELANAMLLSAWTNRTVDIPLDAAAYARQLKQKIKTSKPRKKKRVVAAVADLSKSFNS